MQSIFTIERRRDFKSEFAKFFRELRTSITTTSGTVYTIIAYLDRCIKFWPYRYGATSIDDYLKAINVDITNPKCDTDLLLTLELIINLLYWAPHQDAIDDKNSDFVISFVKNEVQTESDRLIENATYMLEQCCNMSIREEKDGRYSKYHITKRKTEVDSVLDVVPELSNLLLGYMDVRNANDLKYKEKVLLAIYGELEPRRKEIKAWSCSAVSEEYFADMNKFGIRHNTEKQIKLTPKKKLIVYDKLFDMGLYVFHTEKVKQHKDELAALRTAKDKQMPGNSIKHNAFE